MKEPQHGYSDEVGKWPQRTKAGPVFAKTFFPVQVAVFEHANDGRPNYSVKLTRSFRRDEESEWETTEYLRAQDLLPAARLLGEAYDAIQSLLDSAYRERQNRPADESIDRF